MSRIDRMRSVSRIFHKVLIDEFTHVELKLLDILVAEGYGRCRSIGVDSFVYMDYETDLP